MFDELSGKFEDAIKSLRGQDQLSESNISPALKSVKRALLDADVSLTVIDEFLEEVKRDALGKEVVRGIKPEQKFIEVVHKRLVEIMGDQYEGLAERESGGTIVMLVGLQGAGKTTASAKLGLYLKEKSKRVLLIAADTFRPAAKEQLKTLGRQLDIPVYTGADNDTSKDIAYKGVAYGKEKNVDVMIIDTAGRLYIDKEMMEEASNIKAGVQPDETLLVVDAMIGQEAAELTRTFSERVGITGAILTKLDGDARGGAALSIRKVSGKPIKFIGVGEKVEALEPFYPDRIASRILGMGDILSLVDKAQKEVDVEDVISMQKKFEQATFDFNDFLKQMRLLKRMGSISGLMKLIPGMNKIDTSTLRSGEQQLKKIESMIGSMTEKERKNPELLIRSQKRKRRIASGSGHKEAEVEKVIVDFERMKQMMQNLARGDFSQIQGQLMNQSGVDRNKNASKSVRSGQTKATMRSKDIKRKRGFFEL